MNIIFKLHAFSTLTFNLPIIEDFSIDTNIHSSTNKNLTPILQDPNEEQRFIINNIISLVKENNTNTPNAYFIDGPGGTGKTFVYNYLIHSCSQLGFDVIAVAWTGIAAMLLPNGRTVHSRFKLPLKLTESSVSFLKVNSKEAEIIKAARLIIWDEAPMANVYALMCVDRLLKDLMDNDVPFGGKVIVLGGDFRQVLPVVPHASRQTIVQNCIKFSPLWKLFKIFKLTINMRAKEEEIEFANFLLQIGNGDYPAVSDEQMDTIALPTVIIAKKDIISEIYGESFDLPDKFINFANVAILAPKNEHCNEINSKVIDLIPGKSRSYVSCNYLITEDENEVLQYPSEFLNSLEVSGLPPHNLKLKSGAIVILLRNLNVSQGLLNGTRLIVHDMYDNSLHLEIITGKNAGHRVLLPRVDLTPSDSTLPFSFKRRQFPIRLAFCLTINKAQGQTFDRVGLYLPQPVFSHGQLYVAMSRARSFENLKVQIEPKSNETLNVVFKEVL